MQSLQNGKHKMSKKIDRNNIHKDDRYETIPILLEQVIVDPQSRIFILLSDGEKKVACEIAPYEASILNFVIKEYHLNAHVMIIHQMFLRLLNHYNSSIDSICIENKIGDVIYASVKFTDYQKNSYFSVCSLVDSLILSILSQTNLFVLRNVWDNMDELDEDWDYESYLDDDIE